MNLLLLSNSTGADGYLAYAQPAIAQLAAGARRAVFAPFAGVVRDWDDYTRLVQQALKPQGFAVEPLHRAGDPLRALREAELIVVGGGNTFHLLHHCRRLGLLTATRDAVLAGVPYLGWSAGSNLACPTIRTTNDMPVIDPGGLDALNLVPLQINPHYTNALPEGIRGETRNQRIAEFTRLWPAVPVLGLPEGNWLRVSGAAYQTGGPHASWWFQGDAAPREVAAGRLAFEPAAPCPAAVA